MLLDQAFTMKQISNGADGGPRSLVCACLTLCSAPHRHQWKLMGGGGQKLFKKFLIVLMGG